MTVSFTPERLETSGTLRKRCGNDRVAFSAATGGERASHPGTSAPMSRRASGTRTCGGRRFPTEQAGRTTSDILMDMTEENWRALPDRDES